MKVLWSFEMLGTIYPRIQQNIPYDLNLDMFVVCFIHKTQIIWACHLKISHLWNIKEATVVYIQYIVKPDLKFSFTEFFWNSHDSYRSIIIIFHRRGISSHYIKVARCTPISSMHFPNAFLFNSAHVIHLTANTNLFHIAEFKFQTNIPYQFHSRPKTDKPRPRLQHRKCLPPLILQI